MKLYIEELTGGKHAVLSNLANDPTFLSERFKGAGKTAERAAEIAASIARGKLVATITPELTNMLATFTVNNGPRPAEPGLEQDEWDSAIDDEVAAVLEPYAANYLSANWLGEATVDTQLHAEGELAKLAMGFAKEVWRMLLYDKETGRSRTANQMLAGVGIVGEDIDAFLQRMRQPQDIPPPPMHLEEDMALNAVLNRIMLFVPDNAKARGDIGLVANDETDEYILPQAMARLGIDADDVETIRLAVLAGHTTDTLATLVEQGEMLDEAADDVEPFDTATGEFPAGNAPDLYATSPAMPAVHALDAVQTAPAAPPPAPLATDTGAVPPIKRTRKPKGPAAAAVGQVPPEVLTAFKESANINDEEVATALGLSRATYNNFVRGKQPFVPNDNQRAILRNIVVGKVNGLLTALSTYDGVPYDTLE